MKRMIDINNRFICGDALTELSKFPAESIDMCLTSPPYWGLRDYGFEYIFGGDPDCEHKWDKKIKKWHSDRGTGPKKEIYDDTFQVKGTRNDTCLKCQAWKGQLGLEPTPELYIEHLTEMFNKVKRVLKKEGTLWLNIGDTYGGSGGAGGDYNKGGLREGQPRFKQGQTKLQPKCLCMIPERLAWSLIQNGWILRNKNIWHKRNSMPSSAKDRFNNTYEFVYMFSKSNKPIYWINKKTLKLVMKQPAGIKGIEEVDWKWERCPRCEGRGEITKEAEEGPKKCSRCNGSGKIKMSFWTAHDYYFDLDAVREPHKEIDRRSIGEDGERIIGRVEYFKGDYQHGIRLGQSLDGKNPGDVFEINTQPFPEAHFAVFPEKLCEKPIKAGCPEGGIVLDPFCGAGTVGVVAKNLGRRFILIDIKEEYMKMAKRRIAQVGHQKELFK